MAGARRRTKKQATAKAPEPESRPPTSARAAGPGPLRHLVGGGLLFGGVAIFLLPAWAHGSGLALQWGDVAPWVGALALAAGAAVWLRALWLSPSEVPIDEVLGSAGDGVVGKLRELHPKRFFLDTWRALDAEADAERHARAEAGKGYDYRPLVIFGAGAVFLTLMEYYGHATSLRAMIDYFDPPDQPPGDGFFGLLRDSPYRRLIEFVWWGGWRVLGFFILPALTLKLLGLSVAEHGLSTKGFLDHAWIYGLFYCIVLIAVVVVSYDETFATYYPFYKESSRSLYDFAAWELVYAAQFFSLEFFFRGYWLKAAKSAMGSHAIYAMVVPYCMIHFGKPFLETIAAILAGVVLGTLALRTRSIWSGFLIHVSVALSMDVAALLQGDGLPTRFWP